MNEHQIKNLISNSEVNDLIEIPSKEENIILSLERLTKREKMVLSKWMHNMWCLRSRGKYNFFCHTKM